MTHGIDARRLLRHSRSGALATLSTRLKGHPYASVVPFMSDFDGAPVLLISRLAEHTKNIEADARVSLLVHEPKADVQAAARLTVVGTCGRIEADTGLRERYVRLFPDASDLLTLDFDFYRIVPSTVRYIGGFGKIHWVEATSFLNAGGIDARVESEWLARCASMYREEGDCASEAAVRLVTLDCDGIDVRSTGGCVTRRDFPRPVSSATELPSALRTLLRETKR